MLRQGRLPSDAMQNSAGNTTSWRGEGKTGLGSSGGRTSAHDTPGIRAHPHIRSSTDGLQPPPMRCRNSMRPPPKRCGRTRGPAACAAAEAERVVRQVFCAGVPRLASARAGRPPPQAVAPLRICDLKVAVHQATPSFLLLVNPVLFNAKSYAESSIHGSTACSAERCQLVRGCGSCPAPTDCKACTVLNHRHPRPLHNGTGGRPGVAKDVAPPSVGVGTEPLPSASGVVQRARLQRTRSSAAVLVHPTAQGVQVSLCN